MQSFSLPALSLKGWPASLRGFPEGAESRIGKALIWRVLLSFERSISGVGLIFLPTLRDASMGAIAVEWDGSHGSVCHGTTSSALVASARAAPPKGLIATRNRQPGGGHHGTRDYPAR